MRILVLTTWFPFPPDNGSKLRSYHLLRALTHTHEVTLISFLFGTTQPDATGALQSLVTDIHTVSVDPFLFNQAGALKTFLSLRPTVTRPIPSMCKLVREVLQSSPFDVIIASTEVMSAYALLTSSRTTRILEEHNAMNRWARERYQKARGVTKRLRCWVSWQKSQYHIARMYPRFDLITMVSENDRRAIMNAMDDKQVSVAVVPNGVDCDQTRFNSSKTESHMLIYNGALTYSANYDAMQWFLAEIYPYIKAQIPNVGLTITGSTKSVDLSGLALDSSVRMTGYLHDVHRPVAQAAVGVAPIREGGGTRLKILEAMALGTPVVATSKGAEGLEIVDGEHLLLADTPVAFAKAVLRVMNDRNLREHLRRRARAFVETQHNWKDIGARFVTLVEETAERKLMNQ
jgi:glycosyltransferase involved in cell wall biosynthesis